MMKYMHQYKQKKKEKDEYFGFVAKIHSYCLAKTELSADQPLRA